MRNSSQPSEAIASTASSAGWPVLSIAALMAAMSLRALDAVSTWVTSTARISWALSARKASAMRWGSAGLDLPKSRMSTLIPSRCRPSAQPWPNRPVAASSARSPRENMLQLAASQAPWPLAM
ncbi:hypothetical protein D3C87_1795670 [compost metagenome]